MFYLVILILTFWALNFNNYSLVLKLFNKFIKVMVVMFVMINNLDIILKICFTIITTLDLIHSFLSILIGQYILD
jgi:hypothetical protein